MAEGFSRTALGKWLARGRRALESTEPIAAEEMLYRDFAVMFRRACAKARIVQTQRLYTAGEGDWKAALEWLKRNDPRYFPNRVGGEGEEGSVTVKNAVQVNVGGTGAGAGSDTLESLGLTPDDLPVPLLEAIYEVYLAKEAARTETAGGTGKGPRPALLPPKRIETLETSSDNDADDPGDANDPNDDPEPEGE